MKRVAKSIGIGVLFAFATVVLATAGRMTAEIIGEDAFGCIFLLVIAGVIAFLSYSAEEDT